MEQTTAKKFKGDKREGREKNEALRMLRALCITQGFLLVKTQACVDLTEKW